MGERIFGALAGVVVFLAALSGLAQGGWTAATSWGQLQKNMVSDAVKEILGTPKETEEIGQRVIWYYQEIPVRQGGRVISRPKEGYVVFAKMTADPVTQQALEAPGLYASQWVVPDWRTITDAEKLADMPAGGIEAGGIDMKLPAEMQQQQQEFQQRQEERRRLMEEQMRQREEERKKMEAEMEQRQRETMERIQKQREEMQQRMQEGGTPMTPGTGMTTSQRPRPEGAMSMQRPAEQSRGGQTTQAVSAARKAGRAVGFVVGFAVAIAAAVAIFPALMMGLVRLIAGLSVTWWTCCKAYLMAHVLGGIVLKGVNLVSQQGQVDDAGIKILSLVVFGVSLGIYAGTYQGMVKDEAGESLGWAKGAVLTLIIDALPLLILYFAFASLSNNAA